MSGEMNRRGFIKGAGVFAAAACGGAANGGTLNAPRTAAAPGHDVDVLVVGGGSAGVCAAIAAALCVKTGATPRTLDATALVRTLKAQGTFLGFSVDMAKINGSTRKHENMI